MMRRAAAWIAAVLMVGCSSRPPTEAPASATEPAEEAPRPECTDELPEGAILRVGDPCMKTHSPARVIAYRPGDNSYFTGNADGQLVEWSVDTRRPLRTIELPRVQTEITALAVGPEHIAVGTKGAVLRWNRRDEGIDAILAVEGTPSQVYVAGERLAALVYGELWLGTTQGLQPHPCCGGLRAAALSADGERAYVTGEGFATALEHRPSDDGTPGEWEQGSWVLRSVELLALSPDGDRLAVSSPDGRVAVIDVASARPIAARDEPLDGGTQRVAGLGWTSSGQRLFMVSEHVDADHFDTEQRGLPPRLDVFSALATPERSVPLPVLQVPVSIGMGLAFAGSNSEPYWFDLRQNGWVDYTRRSLPDEDPQGLSWSLDGERLLLATHHSLRVVQVSSGETIHEVRTPCLLAAALARDETHLAVLRGLRSREDGVIDCSYSTRKIEWWDLRSHTRRVQRLGRRRVIFDGGMATIVHEDGLLELVDLATGDAVASLPPSSGGPEADRRLLVMFADEPCHAWRADGRSFATIRGGELVRAHQDGEDWRISSTTLTLPPEGQRGLSRDRFFGRHEHQSECWFDEDGALWVGTPDRLWKLGDDGQLLLVEGERDRIPSGLALAYLSLEPPPWRSVHAKGWIATAVSPDGQRVATYGKERLAYVWGE